MIEVSCGLIQYNNKYIITQRSKIKKEFPLYWELPGGKCQQKESITESLIRELQEELNITVQVEKIIYIKNKYLNKYNLNYYLCSVKDINIKLNKEIENFAIVDENELFKYKFIPGDFEVLKYYFINVLSKS